MSELLSQRLPNCSVKPPAGGGERSREGNTERASREEEKVHTAQTAAFSTRAACHHRLASLGEPSPHWKRLLPDSTPDSEPFSSSAAGGPKSLRAAAPASHRAILATKHTAVLRVTK